jgi:osmoprotectant transport system substrate-binding protein
MSAITTEGFVALDDDKTLVPHEAVLPLLTTAAATPDVVQILDSISAQLNTDVLKAMMVKIEVDKQSPEVVAKAFLGGDFASASSTTVAGSTPTSESAPPTT